jgi:hypothetical protein
MSPLGCPCFQPLGKVNVATVHWAVWPLVALHLVSFKPGPHFPTPVSDVQATSYCQHLPMDITVGLLAKEGGPEQEEG